MKTVGFVATHPGSVNTLTHLISEISSWEVTIKKFPFSPYAAKAWNTETWQEEQTEVDLTGLDLVVYSPACGLKSEYTLVENARSLGITSVAIIDIFFMSTTELMKRFEGGYPDFIIVPDVSTYLQLIKYGVPSNVLPLGNSHFEMLGVGRTKSPVIETICIVSQPKGISNSCPTDSRIIAILNSIVKHRKSLPNLKEVIIATHPRECRYKWIDYLTNLNPPECLDIYLEMTRSTHEVCESTHAVVGLSSTVLVEQQIKGSIAIYFVNDKKLVEDLNRDHSSIINYDFHLADGALRNTLNLFRELLAFKEY